MSMDSREQRNDVSLGWVKQQLRALSAAQPPRRLEQRLLADLPGQTAEEALPWHVRRWPRATRWAGIAAAIVVLCSLVWLRPQVGPPTQTLSDAKTGPGRVLAADYNSVRPADINALDSNGLN
jgi:ferric-dicitrate binding protein FerR (iron transport regulator)